MPDAVNVPAHDDDGVGRPVLLLHAGVADRRMWKAVSIGLQEVGYRVIAPDLPGFGETRVCSGEFSFATLVHQLLVDIDAVPAAVVGNSFGGLVALDLALAFPDDLSSLVLISAASDAHRPSAPLREFGAAEDLLLEAGDIDGATELNVEMWSLGGDTSGLVREMQRRAFELQAEVLDPPAHSQWQEFTSARLAALGVPTLVVTGDRDVEDFAVIGDDLAATIPGARRIRIPGAGHLMPLEEPETTIRLIVEHLAR